jgi:hypothetical protein
MPVDYNKLPQWLTRKLDERRMSVDDLAYEARISRTVIYMWLNDTYRPTPQSMIKVCRALSGHKVWKKAGNGSWTDHPPETVDLVDALRQFTEKRTGRPRGSGGGTGLRPVHLRGERDNRHQ